jgi:drug/metabolite transporter (DMT)-like permease
MDARIMPAHDHGEKMLWAIFTLIAAAAQTARNAMQRELTATLGTVGATHVRFLFGFPFALFIFLPGVMVVAGYGLPNPPLVFWPWVVAGALMQIGATATMLSVMGERSFVVAYAYIKTEPVQVALFGLIFLGDKVTALSGAAILIATAGVIVISLKPGAGKVSTKRSTLIGLFSGSLFALSAIGYRGAILSLELPHFVMAATFTLAVGLVLQAALLSGYLMLRDPGVLRAIGKAWKPSLFAGFMGAFASEFWFLGFAIASAANVRTLALVEVLFAQGVTRFIFKQPTSPREGVGIVLVVIGVALLVWAY